ncbi:MAG: MltA domain-containing protein [Gammaproteobacteria bacterium]|nr:MltA domain-containing protein [Gammaproteobacteria bacterium]MCY4274193.1 MltA domain-containing protein [Gammaproteobacteria bacterium]
MSIQQQKPLASRSYNQWPCLALFMASILVLSACTTQKPAGIGNPIEWNEVTGWNEDQHADSWPALMNNCRVLIRHEAWSQICKAARSLNSPDHKQAREFYETWFTPHAVHGADGKTTGLITGYYEPLLFGSTVPDENYRYPIYQRPENLLRVDLSELYPELEGKRVRGRLEGNSVIPYFTREQIDSELNPLKGEELLWLNDRDDVFFLHIQGSGRIKLTDGRIIGAGYSDQNGHPYVAIGKVLIDWGELEREEVTLFSIREWLHDHPAQARVLLNQNPSYVFFEIRENVEEGPIGSLATPLTPERSIAIDPSVIPLGTPIWLETYLPDNPEQPYNRLYMSQDTGGAIKGPLRADIFWGNGDSAEYMAGLMKEQGKLIALLPKTSSIEE